MKNILLFMLVFAVVGFIVGYLIYAKHPITGDYISIPALLGLTDSNFFEELVSGAIIEPIRQRVFTATAVGGVLGALIAVGKAKINKG